MHSLFKAYVQLRAALFEEPHKMARRRPGSDFVQAVRFGSQRDICELVEAGVDVQSPLGDYALRMACMSGQKAVVELLIKANVDVNSTHGLPLWWAAKTGRLDIFDMLINNGASAGSYALREAYTVWQPEVVGRLIEAGADADEAEFPTTWRPTIRWGRHRRLVLWRS